MKKLLLLFLGLFLFGNTYAQDTLALIYEEQFDGGIPAEWEIGPGNPEGAIWQWSEDAQADDAEYDGDVINALFWGTRGPIQSPSADNGAAMFNSDVYDGGGVGVGSGPFPGTHGGALTSPSIDCSEYPFVSLKMNQYARANSNTVSTIFEVSNDGGMTWVDFPINSQVIGNAGTAPDNVLLVDISSVAGGQSDVKLRFTWSGRYYYWLIDDVQLIETPRLNLALADTIFYPPANYATPLSQIDTDTMGFFAQVENLGRDTQFNAVLKASVIDLATEEVLFVDSTIIDTLPAFSDLVTVDIEEVFIPEGLNIGEYNIVYEIYSPESDQEDFNDLDNSFSETFVTTDNIFSKEDGNIGGVRPGGGGDYQFGNLFRMSPLAGDGFKATLAQFGAGKSSADGPIAGESVTIFLYKVSDDVLPDFSNFDDSSTGQGDDLEIVGFNNYSFPEEYENYDLADVELLNIDADPGIDLEAGGRYFLVVSYEGTATTIFAGTDIGINYFFQISTIVFTSNWFLGGFGPDNAAAVRMTIEMVDNTDTQPLKETAMNLFPNPASDELTVDLDLDVEGDAMIIIASADGKIMMMREYDNVQDENMTFDISNYPAGSYFVRVGTLEGTKTKQFVKIAK